MRFGSPHVLIYLGWLVPAIIVFFIIAGRWRRKAMETFAHKEIIGKVAIFYSARIRRLSVILTIAAIALIVIGLAHPQWQYYWKENKKKGIDMIIGIDISRSMLATDVAPSRLAAAKAEIEEFAKKLKGDRIGLIVFSGSAFLQCPLTVDYKGFILALNSVGPITVSRGGTAISSAIREAVRCYRGAQTPNKIFILISDGEHLEGDIDKAILLAIKEKITIYCIGVGTVGGSRLYETDKSGDQIPINDEYGKPVISRLNEATLRKIAATTGGLYKEAAPMNFGLDSIYEERLAKLEKRESQNDKVKVYQEKYQYPVALACLLLIAEMILREKESGEET